MSKSSTDRAGKLISAFLIAGMVLVLMATWPCDAQQRSDRNVADTLYNEGYGLLERQDYGAAANHFERASVLYRKLGLAKEGADALLNLGIVAWRLGEYNKALRYYHQALVTYRKLGLDKEEAYALTNLGAVADELDQYNKALDYYNQALGTYRKLGLAREEACALENLGIVADELGEYTEALRYYNQALATYHRLGLEEDEAGVLRHLGIVAGELGEYSKAMGYYNKALATYRSLGLAREEANALRDLGILARDLGQYNKALGYYNQALATYRKLGLASEEADALRCLGGVACRLGEYNKALGYYDQASATYRKLGLNRKEADALIDLGVVADDLGDYSKALSYYNQALATYRKLGLEEGEADALRNLGIVAWRLGEYNKALRYHNRALAIYRRFGLERDEADALIDLGVVADDLGEYSKAMGYYSQALATYHRLGLEEGEASALRNLGVVAEDVSEYDKALSCYNQALAIYRRLGLNQDTDGTELNTADLWMSQGNLGAARSVLVRVSSGSSLRWGRYYLLVGDYRHAAREFGGATEGAGHSFMTARQTGLGLALEAVGQWDEAAAAYEKAVALVEEARATTTPADRRQFLEAKDYGFPRLWAYEGLARVLSELGKQEEAFLWSEHTKGRSLMEAIARAQSGAHLGVSWSLRKKEQNLANRTAATKKQIEGAFEKGNKELRRRLERGLNKLKREQEALIAQLRRDYPEYAAMQYPQPLRASELALNKGEVLIEYEVTDPVTLIFVVRDGKVQKAIQAKVTRKDLNDMITSYRAAFVETGQSGSYESLRKLDVRLGHDLYQLLLKDALAGVKKGEKVLIVPDEMLCLLPFEALVEQVPPGKVEWEDRGHGPYPKGVRYVGDTRVFSYWQSASSMTILRRLHKDVGGSGLLAVADPVFGEADARIKSEGVKLAMRGATDDELELRREVAGSTCRYLGFKGFPRLETTGGFVKRLRSVYGNRLTALTGFDATESRVESEELDNYGSGVVFATHGIVDERVPYFQQAAIVLSNPELTGELNKKGRSGDTETCDGFLTMSEIMGLKMPTEMAAALACVTGMGSMVGGEGVMNLGRAFQYAGARSALISLWSVEDESTNLLGERLFAGMRNGEAKDTALLAARRMLRAKGYEHPFYWAGFSLIGERGLAPRTASRVVWFVAVLLAVLCVIIALRVRGVGLWKRSVSD